MARAARELFGDRIRAGLIVGVDAADPEQHRGFQVIVGGHPAPSVASEQGGRRALELAASLQSDETLVVLLSGGASALMAVPADGVLLEDKQAATRQLLRAGADIHALNTVRKHLSAIKGGWLAARASGPCLAFAISDVVGDDLSVIGSGPDGAGSEHISRCARHPSTLRRCGCLSACRCRSSDARRAGPDPRDAQTKRPDARTRSNDRHRRTPERDGRRDSRGRVTRLSGHSYRRRRAR